MEKQIVRLSVPAEPSYARSVRMMAANLAVVSDMSVEDVEDVRMAAEEGFVYACSTELSTCEVTFTLDERRCAIDFMLGAPTASSDDEATSYAKLLLAAVCDEFELDEAASMLHLVKLASEL